MRFRFPALCLLCLALSLAFPVSAKATCTGKAFLSTAPVYYRADDTSACIGYLSHDTQLTVLGQQEDYFRIDCYDMTGYLHKSYVTAEGKEYYVNCKTNRVSAKTFIQWNSQAVAHMEAKIYRLSTALTGVPYLYGGNSPSGFDCSGFTGYIYRQLGITLPRTCDGQLSAGLIISKASLRCGDLVLFQRTTGNGGIATHVGIYLGSGKLIHAGSRGITVVDLDSAYFRDHYLCARRILLSENSHTLLPFTEK